MINKLKKEWAEKLRIVEFVKIQKERNQAMKQVKEMKGEFKLLQQERDIINDLINGLLCSRILSPSYLLYLQEKHYLFKLIALKENRPYKTRHIQDFLEAFQCANFS